MHRALVLAAVLLGGPLAGCVGGGDVQEQAAEPTAPTDEADGVLEAPTWSIGDHWTYRSAGFGEVTWVVTGDQGRDWIVDTTHEGVAFLDAREDVSFLGKVRKGDLAGSQGDDRVTYFDWPLEPNKTWTTTWDGIEREVTVDRVEDGAAHLTARQDGRVAVEYTYDAGAGHMSDFTFYDANGTEEASGQLLRSGSNLTEPAVRWQLETIVDRSDTFGAQSWGDSFEVHEEATDLWLDLGVRCPSGAFEFGFGGNGSGWGVQEACPYEDNVTGPVIEDPDPGTWSYGMTASSPAEEGRYDVLLYLRTLEEVPVGEG